MGAELLVSWQSSIFRFLVSFGTDRVGKPWRDYSGRRIVSDHRLAAAYGGRVKFAHKSLNPRSENPDMREPRRIRSFVMRAGRMTEGQQRGWNEGLPRYGLEVSSGSLDWDKTFGRSGKRVVEIGFGMGDSLFEMAQAAPESQFIGIEVHTPGVGRLLSQVLDSELDNVRVYAEDAVPVLRDCLPDGSIDVLQIFFPDPWHKKRHNKRRLIQPEFIAMVGPKIAAGGIIHLATDWQPYAEHMLEVMEGAAGFSNVEAPGAFSERRSLRPETKFERRGARLGHGVWDLRYRRSEQ